MDSAGDGGGGGLAGRKRPNPPSCASGAVNDGGVSGYLADWWEEGHDLFKRAAVPMARLIGRHETSATHPSERRAQRRDGRIKGRNVAMRHAFGCDGCGLRIASHLRLRVCHEAKDKGVHTTAKVWHGGAIIRQN